MIPSRFICPNHSDHELHLEVPGLSGSSDLICDKGCRYERVKEIYRFVNSQGYSSSFGLQWRKYRLTQLDSYTGKPLSSERLKRCLGGSFDSVRGKKVLEAGCGAGRFTEVLLREGADLVSTDLSSAVEANWENFKGRDNYFVCQANILKLPFAPGQFDVVICLGVIQHTPNPEETIKALVSHVKPGGLLVIDHYLPQAHGKPAQLFWRPILLRLPATVSFAVCKLLVTILWPLHRIAYMRRNRRGGWRLARMLDRISPVLDYQGFFDLPPKDQRAWAMLDTHDALTDFYKHGRNLEQIEAALKSNSMTDINVWIGGNGIEANARKPL